MTDPTIALADDHLVLLQGLERLLRDEGFTVVGTASNTDDALALVRRTRPAVLVLDLRMGPADGLAVARSIRDEGLPTAVVLLTAAISDRDALEAAQLGIRGVVLKEMAAHQIARCIRKVHAGGEWVEGASTARAMERLIRREGASRELEDLLTPREIEVLRVAATGIPNREIAAKLSIAEGTVKMHLHSIYDKLGLAGRLELMLYANRAGLSD